MITQLEHECIQLLTSLKKHQPQISISFSGPSSSGKTCLRKSWTKLCKAANWSVGERPSVVRQLLQADATLAERGAATFQMKLLEESIKVERQLRDSAADIILFDRNFMDGYLYNLRYQTLSVEQLEYYWAQTLLEISKFDICFLLEPVCFIEDDGHRKKFDLEFQETFCEDFRKHWPKQLTTLVTLPKIVGLDKVYERSLFEAQHQLQKMVSEIL